MSIKTTTKKVVLAVIAAVFVIAAGYFYWAQQQYVVPILMYHHIGDPSVKPLVLNDVSVPAFDHQMQYLEDNQYHVISTVELVEGLKQKIKFPRKTVVIQFDDGYENNYTNAFPILKKHGFPVMVFVVSDFIGTPGFLTWSQIKEMEASQFLIGSHTRHHKYLPKLSEFEQYDEIVGSKKILEDNLKHPIEYFAYPTGGFTPYAKEVVAKAGYKAAMTTNRGKDKSNHDLFEIKRIRIKNTDKDYVFSLKVSGFYNLYRSTKNGE